MSRLIMLLLFSCLAYQTLNAQNNPAKSSVKTQKVLPKKLITSFGGYRDSAVLSTEVLKGIISSPLIVKDDKGAILTISNFQVAYTRQIISEDEATGKLFPSTQLVTALFTAPTLSPIWIKTIKRDLLPKEEILFYDIVVKDIKGLGYYAPNLKIITTK